MAYGMRTILFWLLGIAVLVTGLFLASSRIVVGKDPLLYAGTYSCHIGAQCLLYGADEVYRLEIQGETRLEWWWNLPRNPKYQKLTLAWDSDSDEGRAVVELPALEYRHGTSQGVLTSDVLYAWMSGAESEEDPSLRDAIGEVMAYIRKAGRGELPPPQHHLHSHHVEDVVTIAALHGVSGGVHQPLIHTTVWIALWSVGMWGINRRRLMSLRKRKRVSREMRQLTGRE